MSHAILEVVGWSGSLLLVVSLLQPSMFRLRILNLTASAILVTYNAFIGVWPMAVMNAAVAVINIVYIVRLRRAKSAPSKERGRAYGEKLPAGDASEPDILVFADESTPVTFRVMHEDAATSGGIVSIRVSLSVDRRHPGSAA